MRIFRETFISGRPVVDGRGAGPVRWAVFLVSSFVFSFSLTIMYHGMRGVMMLGGFVASGGPYEIAHPAPDWVWLMPVAVLLMVISIFASIFSALRINGPNIMALSWSALFTSLGWNFLQYGFGIGMGGQLAVGWITCAVVFLPMGLLPLIFVLRSFFRSLNARRNALDSEYAPPTEQPHQLSWSASLLLQVILCGLGVWLGIFVFSSVS